MKKILFKICPALFLLLYLVLINFKIITKSEFFYVDDQSLISPFINIKSFFDEYFKLQHLDLQPLRDLTFFIDAKFSAFFKVSTFRFTNLLIFFSSLLVFEKCLALYINNKNNRWLILLAISSHPTFVMSIYWISARKHLLANLYFLMSLYTFISLSYAYEKISGIVFYNACLIFSFLSQPIFLWSPFWCLWHNFTLKPKIDNKEFQYKQKMALSGICISFVFGLTNFFFYYYLTKKDGTINVGGSYDAEHLSNIVLSYGRYFTNVLFPISLHYDYSKSSWLNIIGIPVLAIYLIKSINSKEGNTSIYLLPIFSLFLVTFHKIGTFVNDTYAIFFTMFIISVVFLRVEFFLKHRNISLTAQVIIIMLFSFKYQQRANLITNHLEFSKSDVEKEMTPINMLLYINNLLIANQDLEAIRLYKNYYEVFKEQRFFPINFFHIISDAIYKSPNFYPNDKIKLLYLPTDNPSIFAFYRGLIYADQGKEIESFNEFYYSLLSLKNNDEHDLDVLAFFYSRCATMKNDDCISLFLKKYTQLTIRKKIDFESRLEHVDKFTKRNLVISILPYQKIILKHEKPYLEAEAALGIIKQNQCVKF